MSGAALIEAIGNTEYWFDALDQYQGEEADRIAWLADEWTVRGDEPTEAERHWNMQAQGHGRLSWIEATGAGNASHDRRPDPVLDPLTPPPIGGMENGRHVHLREPVHMRSSRRCRL